MTLTLVLLAFVAGAVAMLPLGCGASYEQAKVRGSDINSMMAIRDVSIALERYRPDHGSYPTVDTMAELHVVAVNPLIPMGTLDPYVPPVERQ